MAYIAFGGNNGDSGKNTEHIENLLRSSNAQNKVSSSYSAGSLIYFLKKFIQTNNLRVRVSRNALDSNQIASDCLTQTMGSLI